MRRSADDRRRALGRGQAAEAWVAARLEEAGWQVLARNWRGYGAELDLIVCRDGVVRFVEVKARDPADPFGVDVIDHRKQAKLTRGAEGWLNAHGEPARECAFLIAMVTPGAEGWEVEWWDDPF